MDSRISKSKPGYLFERSPKYTRNASDVFTRVRKINRDQKNSFCLLKNHNMICQYKLDIFVKPFLD